jgi:hypothetical protein
LDWIRSTDLKKDFSTLLRRGETPNVYDFLTFVVLGNITKRGLIPILAVLDIIAKDLRLSLSSSDDPRLNIISSLFVFIPSHALGIFEDTEFTPPQSGN